MGKIKPLKSPLVQSFNLLFLCKLYYRILKSQEKFVILQRINQNSYLMSINKQFQTALLIIADGYLERMYKLKVPYNHKDNTKELEHPQLSVIRKFIHTDVFKNDKDTIDRFNAILKSLNKIYTEEKLD